MRVKRLINKAANRFGYEINSIDRRRPRVHTDNFLARRRLLIEKQRIDVLLDVGANIGQFAQSMRALGFQGTIVSFEPLSSAFAQLKNAAAKDPLWLCENYAIGEREGTKIINISANSVSSSFLEVRDIHLRVAPSAQYVGTEEVTMKTLDSVVPRLVPDDAMTFLKIDTQGYERHILQGADNVLNRIVLMQIETSLFSQYEGDSTICEMICYLDKAGFYPVSIEPGFSDSQTGQQYQVDVLFRRHSVK